SCDMVTIRSPRFWPKRTNSRITRSPGMPKRCVTPSRCSYATRKSPSAIRGRRPVWRLGGGSVLGEERLGIGALDQHLAHGGAAERLKADRLARLVRPQAGVQRVPLGNRLVVDRYPHVAGLQ